MIQQIFAKLFGTAHDRQMKVIKPIVDKINSLEPSIQALSDSELQAKTPEFKKRLADGETLDDILPEAFAVVRETSKRILGMRHYDVQLIGGIMLHKGTVAEMKTGEGKTLVATSPMYLNALSGQGAHLVTVNDYLARRDAEWMGRIYNWLGLSVGLIVHDLSDAERKRSYNCDITYGTNNEFGFDYLRDNMKYSLEDYVQRVHNFAIVDECDSILIDEARTPLIISGPAEDNTEKYLVIRQVVPKLVRDVHFTMEEKSKTASLTEEGNAKVEEILGIENVYDPKHIEILHHLYNGLKAYHLYKKDVDYMIKDGEIVIVDEFTGRLMPGRRWSDGLHQAIEVKEGVQIKKENQTLATITFQNYFRMYNKLSGMTGTADTEAVEFKKIYNLDVSVIPTNKGIGRQDKNDIIYKTADAKYRAIIEDIKSRAEIGQPVLVGTISIEKSEEIAQALKRGGVKANVLNARYHEKEAEIIAQAGRKGAITIATNMAGRGTDIVLGGNPEFMAKAISEDEHSPEYKQAFEKFKVQCATEKQDVLAAGGLYIMGTERHESRRIDNQLRGRAGRQGDPGESRFYLSLDDNLLRIFQGDKIKEWMNRLNIPEDEPIDSKMITRSVEGAQKKVEGHNFDIRKHLLEYDDVMNQQRKTIYGLRREILLGESTEDIVKEMMGDITSHILDTYASSEVKEQNWDLQGLNTALNKLFGVHINTSANLSGENLDKEVGAAVKAAYEKQESQVGQVFHQIQRMILLRTIDTRWKEHLRNMDHLKEGINLRAYAQKDPLIEYKKESFNMFEALDRNIKEEALEKIFKVQIMPQENIEQLEEDFELNSQPKNFEMSHPTLDAGAGASGGMPLANPPKQQMNFSRGEPQEKKPFVKTEMGPGRNDPCPCGSGKKYKKCHGAK
ncbi:MAG: preprotein translocase subunit SecA [Bdellovibrionales bacterium]|nr:preprotein translocase subunit SecA [Bdellovibrionales bacterium]